MLRRRVGNISYAWDPLSNSKMDIREDNNATSPHFNC